MRLSFAFGRRTLLLVAMQQNKLSYRQAGKANSGTLVRGHIAGQMGSGKNFSTIPSKFETTLFTGNKERDGFGSRAHRFIDIENDLPGPGTYEDHKAQKDDRIYSKKGLGVGFVSKVKRESTFVPKASASMPGPGSYSTTAGTLIDDVRELNKANRSGSSATFKPPSSKSVVVASDPTPGPGNYEMPRYFDAAQTAAALQREIPMAVFKAKTQRSNTTASSRSMPGPGQYEPNFTADYRYAGADLALPSAAFRSSVPIVGQQPERRLTREQQLGVVATASSSAPGPGEYELPTAALPHTSGIRRRMPQFCDSNHDRFGMPLAGPAPTAQFQVPGPGAYIQDRPPETAVISSAVFMSGTTRTMGGLGAPVPGPAFYSPAVKGARKSFHLNARQRWMPSL